MQLIRLGIIIIIMNDSNSNLEDFVEQIADLSSEERAELFETLDRARLEEYLEIREKYVERLEAESDDQFPEESPLADYCRDHPDDPLCRSFHTDVRERRRELHEEFITELEEQGLMDVEARLIGSRFPLATPLPSPAGRTFDLRRSPVGFLDRPDRDFDLPDEPGPRTPESPLFGSDACGQAAKRVYEARRARFPGFSALGAYNTAQLFADYCRAQIPVFSGRCSEAARSGWADCYAREYIQMENRRPSDDCDRAAERVKNWCEVLRLSITDDWWLPDDRDWL